MSSSTFGVDPESITFGDAPTAMDDVACENLLADDEVMAVVGAEQIVPIGRKASSCYWLADDTQVQLVFNSSPHFPRWRELLLEEYTREIHTTDLLEVRENPAKHSFGVFAADRGLLIHGGVPEEAAITLLLLAISRL